MVRIVEVGPRDGLQNERQPVPTEQKIALVDALSACGVDEIEVSAFVSPKWVPQLADAEQVFAGILRKTGVVYSALVPNEQGLDRAQAARADKIAVFTAASETFNRKNTNASIDESFARFRPVVARARDTGMMIRGYVSTAFWCPYEGAVEAERAVAVVRRLVDMGVDEVSIGDTIGRATPATVNRLLDLLLPHLSANRIAMHFHNTYGIAVANVLASWERGIEAFDASVGGLGGCPYAPGARGNIATEEVVRALKATGAGSRVDMRALAAARDLASRALGRELVV